MFLFDTTDSTRSLRQRHYAAYEQVVASLTGGELVRADRITANSLATASYPINTIIPTRKANSTQFVHQEATKKAKKALLDQARALLFSKDDHQQPKEGSDILNALSLAEPVFGTSDTASGDAKYLIICSDMIEQGARYDLSAPLTSQRMEEIIRTERKRNSLPNLRGVKVLCIGAGSHPTQGLAPDQLIALRDFWHRFFKATGADLSHEWWAPTLLRWPV